MPGTCLNLQTSTHATHRYWSCFHLGMLHFKKCSIPPMERLQVQTPTWPSKLAMPRRIGVVKRFLPKGTFRKVCRDLQKSHRCGSKHSGNIPKHPILSMKYLDWSFWSQLRCICRQILIVHNVLFRKNSGQIRMSCRNKNQHCTLGGSEMAQAQGST